MERIVSFDCNVIKNNNEIVNCLLNNNDLVIFQELMLSECDIDYLALYTLIMNTHVACKIL